MRTLALAAVGLGVCSALAAVPTPDTEPRIDPLRHRSYVETIPGTKVSFEMVAVPGGVYWRGSPEKEPGRGKDEGPAHPVAVAPFWMAKCETTWDEFDTYYKNGPSSDRENEAARKQNADAVTRPTPPYIDETWGYGREGYPVLAVSHHMAMEYCHWLSKKTGRTYRLPTEAEWEWACRAGTTTAYSFGDDPGKLGEYGWYAKNATETTHPVGKKKANPWGLCDLHGNVAEWCLDHYAAERYALFSLVKPTPGPVVVPTEARYSHVVRGGSFADEAAQCRSAARRGSDPSWNKFDPGRPQSIWWLSNGDYVGFRVVRAVTEQRELWGLRSRVGRESR